MHTITDKKLLMLRPEDITVQDSICIREYNEYELKLLACSIAANGIIEPISVRKNDDGKYILISGQRRLRAASMAGLRRIPCLLHKIDAPTAAMFSVVSNTQRKNLAFFDEAKAVNCLLSCFGFSHSNTAAALGIPHNDLANKLGLLRLESTLQRRVNAANLSEEHVKALFRLPGSMREEALDTMIGENMTPKQSWDYVNQVLYPKEVPPTPEKPLRKIAIGDVRLFSNSLSKLISTLKNAGVDTSLRRTENDRYIEFKIKIIKEQPADACAEQLKIC